ncbi:hypothetical protein [Manganibacter manganicus]|uniref:C-type lysozyme inhibitor domain-containing protein n=1 Tax=Manganibacter manganicus TaxID=1873176 RepID=A0A1V8RVD2_9HYPH|nr:hypothetical protein [Pseudaminobacter manganicus]OQM77161.1 hypothetical protein BFN67_10255 [Pseudaminobacter manganicus]
MALRRMVPVTLALLPLFSVVACVSQPGTSNKASQQAAVRASSQPRTATYSCSDGGMMTIENVGTAIRLLGPDGVSEELPAAPPSQRSRYGAEHDAIVLDGKDALVMKSGQMPLNCTR